MIEIFRTNITDQKNADAILEKIHSAFPGFHANFDLSDCDHILRVSSRESLICCATIICLIARLGFTAEVLPDDVPYAISGTNDHVQEDQAFCKG